MDLSNNIPSLENKTLEYLMNPNQYDRLVKKHIEKTIIHNEDLDFYKDRIIQITKDIIDDKIKDKALSIYFSEYAKNVIGYFKFQDKYDIIQEEYKDIINDKNIILENENEIDKIMYDNKKSITLDGFVKKIKKKKQKHKFPEKKKFNLKDPKLKNKGINNNNN